MKRVESVDPSEPTSFMIVYGGKFVVHEKLVLEHVTKLHFVFGEKKRPFAALDMVTIHMNIIECSSMSEYRFLPLMILRVHQLVDLYVRYGPIVLAFRHHLSTTAVKVAHPSSCIFARTL
jgi:hypothetical protein